MKSPFPGMDPYIEAHGYLWEDFHHLLIADIQRALASTLPAPYFAQTGFRAYIVLAEADGKNAHAFQADIGVGSPRLSSRESAGGAAVSERALDEEPVALRPFVATEYREAFIEIYELEPEQRLVTCIEVLSPSNKRKDSPGWEQYLRKRQALLLGEAHFIELDLLRGGTKMPMLDPWPKCPYTLLVSRRERAPGCKVWPAHFLRPLPAIPVPLRGGDPDIRLDLQPLIEGVYERSRYSGRIDYSKPLAPALTEPESAWLAERLRQRASVTPSVSSS